MTGSQYLKFLNPLALFNTKRTRDIFKVNPTLPPERTEADKIVVKVFDYSPSTINEYSFDAIETCNQFNNNGKISWINIDGIRKKEVESLCNLSNDCPTDGNQIIPKNIPEIGGQAVPRHLQIGGGTAGQERRILAIGGSQTAPRSVAIGGTQTAPRA